MGHPGIRVGCSFLADGRPNASLSGPHTAAQPASFRIGATKRASCLRDLRHLATGSLPTSIFLVLGRPFGRRGPRHHELRNAPPHRGICALLCKVPHHLAVRFMNVSMVSSARGHKLNALRLIRNCTVRRRGQLLCSRSGWQRTNAKRETHTHTHTHICNMLIFSKACTRNCGAKGKRPSMFSGLLRARHCIRGPSAMPHPTSAHKFPPWLGSFVLAKGTKRPRFARHTLRGAGRWAQPNIFPNKCRARLPLPQQGRIAHHPLEVTARGREGPSVVRSS